jgi:serine/threonine-protein kinase
MAEGNVATTIAGCQIDAVVSRDELATVYRATDPQRGRQVTIVVLAADPARTDADRERFLDRARLASTLEHPNALTVYEGGETDASLFLVTRWVDGVDLRARIASRGPLTPAEAVRILAPVASALSAAHRHGLAHGAVTSDKVLLAFDEDAEGSKVYLTGFGIANSADDADAVARDIAAVGNLLLETLTGQAASDSEIEAMRTDPGSVSRRLTGGAGEVSDGLATLISRTLAVDPSDRFSSADELVLALERERATARAASLASEQRRRRDQPTAADQGDPAAAGPDGATQAEPARSGARLTPRVAGLVAAAALTVALVVALATYSAGPRGASRGLAVATPTADVATVNQGHLSIGRTIHLGSPAGGLSVPQSGLVWASLPAQSGIVELPPDQQPMTFGGIPDPGPLAAGSSGVWVTLSGGNAVARWADGQLRDRVSLPGRPAAIALDPQGSSAWVADATGGISHVVGGGASPATTRISPPATGLGVGEPDWIWAVNGSLVRIDPHDLNLQTFNGGQGAVGIAVNQGIWLAHTDGTLTRFDPRAGHLQSAVALTAPAPLTGIAAREGSPFVWAISASARSLYEITVAPAQIVGTVRFTTAPTNVAVTHLGVWVTTAGGSLIRIQR